MAGRGEGGGGHLGGEGGKQKMMELRLKGKGYWVHQGGGDEGVASRPALLGGGEG